MNNKDLRRQSLLIEILLDTNATIGERDDAAMDLYEFDNDQVLGALIQVALNPREDTMILNSCGESIGEISVKRNICDVNLFRKLPNWSQNGIYCTIESKKPNWIKDYYLDTIFKGV